MTDSSRARFGHFFAPIQRWFARLADLIHRGLRALEPAPARSVWIGRLVLLALLALGAWIGAESLNLPFGLWADMVLGALVAFLMYALVQLVRGPVLGLLGLLERVWTPGGLVVVLATMGLFMALGLPPQLAIPFGLLLGLGFVLAGAGISLLRAPPRRVVAGTLCLLPGLAVLVFSLVWLLGDEREDDPVMALIEAPMHGGEPWQRYLSAGPYPTGFLTYGSGTDRWRRAYADEVSWRTESVDARDLLNRPSGFGLNLRQRWWGFGLDALPINGRVWYPVDAAGPHPLVLIVHGNHDMMHYSDPGYAWLGEHLASRGHVVVSVDQNFINGGLFGNVPRENGVRGWLLLEHLAAWRQWHSAPEHPMHAQVDLDRVVLIGHSRGGEAAALAAAFNRLERYPEDARIRFDFDFGIQGVAAIAPVDGQFWTSGKPTELEDVSYFVIHGGMDADVYFFSGDRQLVRTQPDVSRGRFSASLYVHHANHGQFNTVWGDNDAGMSSGRLLNRAWLLSGEDQRHVGLLYLTAFVENAVARPAAIPELFCDPRTAGSLLPPTLYVARCDDGRRVILADFEQGLDLAEGSLPGVSLIGTDLDLWAERDVGFRGSPQRRQTGVFLGWHAADAVADQPSQPAWRMDLGSELHERVRIDQHSVLWLDLAQADRDPPPRLSGDDDPNANDDFDSEAVADPDEKTALRPRLAISLLLEDEDGHQSRRALNDFAELLPPLPVRHTRLDRLNRKRYHDAAEPLLQSVAVPLAAFLGSDFDPSRLRRVELQFDPAEPGVLIIERIAITPGLNEQGSMQPSGGVEFRTDVRSQP